MKCRICGSEIDVVFSLGFQPESNKYYNHDDRVEEHYPLHLCFCDRCKLLQMDEVISSKQIFSNDYPYMSSCSSEWLKHCKEYAEYMSKRFSLGEKSYIVEIASNDGCLLKYFKDMGMEVLGVEPAGSVADMAIKDGIPTEKEFFSESYADMRFSYCRKPDLIVANNVIAHNPEVVDFVEGVSIALADDGVFTVEFPHLYNLIKYRQFDTIYHEHYSYFSLYSMMRLFEKCGLIVFDVQQLPTHGGSLRVFGKHFDCEKHEVNDDNINQVLELEKSVYDPMVYIDLYHDIQHIKCQVVSFLLEQKKDNRRVVAYGAPAKGNTFLNFCGVRSDLIEYTVDRSKFKVGKVLPGSRIPIYDVEVLLEDSPDYVFILPWNIKDEIMGYLGKKHKYITAIPEFKIYE